MWLGQKGTWNRGKL